MKTVNEVSKLTGISVRTLHHYDAIGLLAPTKITEAGYRLYDDTALERLQTILLFRELQFPLKEIKIIIDNPGFDRRQALRQQIDLLRLRQKRLGELISFARKILTSGVNVMDFSAFDESEIERYAAEAKAKWGKTEAYKEYEKKEKSGDSSPDPDALMSIFREIGEVRHLPPDDKIVQRLVGRLQNFITANYYNCTTQILKGLGEMYTGDERFKANIDKAGGKGTAEFVNKAIEIYCGI